MTTVTVFDVSSDAAFSFQTSLDSVLVYLSFVWNSRTEHYHLTVKLSDGTVVLDGQKCTILSPIISSAMWEAGLRGSFSIVPISYSIVESAETRRNWQQNYIFSYSS